MEYFGVTLGQIQGMVQLQENFLWLQCISVHDSSAVLLCVAYLDCILRQYQNMISVSSFQINNKTTIHFTIKMKPDQLFNTGLIWGFI